MARFQDVLPIHPPHRLHLFALVSGTCYRSILPNRLPRFASVMTLLHDQEKRSALSSRPLQRLEITYQFCGVGPAHVRRVRDSRPPSHVQFHGHGCTASSTPLSGFLGSQFLGGHAAHTIQRPGRHARGEKRDVGRIGSRLRGTSLPPPRPYLYHKTCGCFGPVPCVVVSTQGQVPRYLGYGTYVPTCTRLSFHRGMVPLLRALAPTSRLPSWGRSQRPCCTYKAWQGRYLLPVVLLGMGRNPGAGTPRVVFCLRLHVAFPAWSARAIPQPWHAAALLLVCHS
ncbi:hypothetical protein VTK73DRAFT_5935 [Phialemonium thermophilum]|uniref:Uncharacterized protein n=1 Tax=Phialemonium thermophilum TaxID=223376 RepID=A0ABR3V0E7_9PEZI